MNHTSLPTKLPTTCQNQSYLFLSSDQGLESNTYQVSIPNHEVWRCWENGRTSYIHLLRLSSALCKKTKSYTHQVSSREISWKRKVTVSNRCFKHYIVWLGITVTAPLWKAKKPALRAQAEVKIHLTREEIETGTKGGRFKHEIENSNQLLEHLQPDTSESGISTTTGGRSNAQTRGLFQNKKNFSSFEQLETCLAWRE